MLFNSYEFVLGFLPITVLGFFWLAHRRSSGRGQPSAMLWLVATSIFFYAWWSPKYTALLIASIGANYACGLAIARARDRAYAKKLVTGAIVGNLCLLSYYKYANFFISTIAAVSGTSFGALDILLPIGISFFTFTQIAFLVDVYCKKAQEYDFIQYMLFVTYFPHLIAGPILHHKEMMPQFGAPETYRFRRSNFAIGITIFIIGLAKKVFLADGFAGWASPIFDSVDAGFRPGFAVAWIGALAYTFQLYFDFSGYSDMAIGLS